MYKIAIYTVTPKFKSI